MLRCPKCKKDFEYVIVRYEGTIYLYEDDDVADMTNLEDVGFHIHGSDCECPECDYEGTRDTFTEVE